MRIAIVDDIKEERAVLYGWLSNQLSKRNIPGDFVEFESGEEFLAAAKKRPFTVVFLDIYMNGANGIEIARELRMSDSDCFLIFHYHIHRSCIGRIQSQGTALSCKTI